MKQPAIRRIEEPTPQDAPKSKRHLQKAAPEKIDSSLLDPSQRSLLASLQPSPPTKEGESSASTTLPPMPPSTVSSRLSRITTGLAPTLDAFAAGIHDIELYRSTADAVSSRILRTCAQRLEERDSLNTQNRLAIEGEDSEQSSGARPPRPREDLGVILGALSRVERR